MIRSSPPRSQTPPSSALRAFVRQARRPRHRSSAGHAGPAMGAVWVSDYRHWRTGSRGSWSTPALMAAAEEQARRIAARDPDVDHGNFAGRVPPQRHRTASGQLFETIAAGEPDAAPPRPVRPPGARRRLTRRALPAPGGDADSGYVRDAPRRITRHCTSGRGPGGLASDARSLGPQLTAAPSAPASRLTCGLATAEPLPKRPVGPYLPPMALVLWLPRHPLPRRDLPAAMVGAHGHAAATRPSATTCRGPAASSRAICSTSPACPRCASSSRAGRGPLRPDRTKDRAPLAGQPRRAARSRRWRSPRTRRPTPCRTPTATRSSPRG